MIQQLSKINNENLPSLSDVAESLHLNEKRREFYLTIQNPEWFAAREAQLQARIDEAQRDLLAHHDALKRAPEVLEECDKIELHLLETQERIQAVAAERRAQLASQGPKRESESKAKLPEVVLVKLRVAFPGKTDAEIQQIVKGV
jgi:hypothetical protein